MIYCNPNAGPKRRLAIITICKNDTLGFKNTVKSLLSCEDSVEFIAVINCFVDTISEYKSIANACKHSKLIFNKDHGLYNAMNIGIRAKNPGNPFLFLNAGDLLNPQCIHQLLQIARSIQQREIFCFRTIITSNPSQVWQALHDNSDLNLVSLMSFYDVRLRESHGLIGKCVSRFFKFPGHQSILYGSSFEESRFDESLKICADIFYNSKVFRFASHLHFVDMVISIFDSTGISNRAPHAAKLHDRILGICNSPISLLDLRILSGTLKILYDFSVEFIYNFFSRNS